jgi:hypothetical protein
MESTVVALHHFQLVLILLVGYDLAMLVLVHGVMISVVRPVSLAARTCPEVRPQDGQGFRVATTSLESTRTHLACER